MSVSYIPGPVPYLHTDPSPVRTLRGRHCHCLSTREGSGAGEGNNPSVSELGLKLGVGGSGLWSSCSRSLPRCLVSRTSLYLKPSPASASSAHNAWNDSALAPSAQSCGACDLVVCSWGCQGYRGEGLIAQVGYEKAHTTRWRGLWISVQGLEWPE